MSVVGQGYVGVEVSKALVSAGHNVIGIEVNHKRIESLKDSVYEITSDYSRIQDSSAVIIAVPTPLTPDKKPDLSFLTSACESIKSWIRDGTLLINESTSFPGTLRNFIAPMFTAKVHFASAPERVDPGNGNWNQRNTPRLVAGLCDEAQSRARELYESICDSVIEVNSPEIAEAAKLFENTFRQVNIALVNEFSQILSTLGIPTFETLEAASTKPYGFMPFLPSVGVGGHCIPVDPIYLSSVAEEHGTEARFIRLANEINQQMPRYVAEKIDSQFQVSGKSVQIAGIAYKPATGDIRESPALELIKHLQEKNATVSWHDPYVLAFGDEKSTPIESVDIGIICTAHPGIDYSLWRSRTKVIDVSSSPDLGWGKYL